MEEQTIILQKYEEFKHIIQAKSNTVAAAKARKERWQKIADSVNSVNGIAVQPRMFGPELPRPACDVPNSTVSVSLPALPVYAVGTRCGPPTRSYVEVKTDICADALKKNFLWLVCRLHSATNQSVPSWTGYNILAANSVNVIPSVVSYLPTINAPATQMATVHEILLQSKNIMTSLHISNMSVAFDQALYCKVIEILWAHRDRFPNIVPRLGVFHTICMLLGVIGKRFQAAGLRDICIESGAVAEGSVSGVLDGHKYNRSLRFHKIMYEALLRLVWNQFPQWLTENHPDAHDLRSLDIRPLVLSVFSEGISSTTVEESLDRTVFRKVHQYFCEFMQHLRSQQGPLARFWMSYFDMVEVVLNLVRASREGNWALHMASIRSIIPWTFAYDNLNYARSLTAYYSEMSSIEHEKPGLYMFLCEGGFSAQLSATNTFAGFRLTRP
ncbi:hypothetical protein D5F01_LYC11269 [Scomber scombrus]|uniref:Myb/SANT-like DNA-binding domain-containing protein n=1 Tax=Scomber scombrus TaxID=13677 RepID=A0AAV1PKC2_SCOSC